MLFKYRAKVPSFRFYVRFWFQSLLFYFSGETNMAGDGVDIDLYDNLEEGFDQVQYIDR